MAFIISDVHGCYYTLMKLLEKIHSINSSPDLIFIGDYADRGLHSKKVVDLLIQLKAIKLRGNHDDVIDFILNGKSESDMNEFLVGSSNLQINDRRLLALSWWMRNGLGTTLQSYQVDTNNYGNLLNDFVNKAQDHKDFYRNLPLFWENDTHFACHAFFRPNEDLPKSFSFLNQTYKNEVLWSRFPDAVQGGILLNKLITWNKIGVFGHTPTYIYKSPVCIKQDKIRLIDTMAFSKTGYMTAYNTLTDECIVQATQNSDILS